MQVGDAVEVCPSIERWWGVQDRADRQSGIIISIVHHEILNAKVYEVMWNDGKIRRQYTSDLAVIKS